jgi:hypothetical protein
MNKNQAIFHISFDISHFSLPENNPGTSFRKQTCLPRARDTSVLSKRGLGVGAGDEK